LTVNTPSLEGLTTTWPERHVALGSTLSLEVLMLRGSDFHLPNSGHVRALATTTPE
jgi:hypothetical protein